MSAAPAKFTFDLDLAPARAGAGFISEAARAALEQQARAQGYAEGLAAGERNAAVGAAQALSAAAAALADRAAALLAGVDAGRAGIEAGAIALAAGIARKLASGLLALQPTAELDALLADCLSSLGAVPHLVVRCHPELADALRDVVAARAATSGFAGRLIVIGEPEIALGDGRIEWAEGGLVRDRAGIEAGIDACITAYLAARGAALAKDLSHDSR